MPIEMTEERDDEGRLLSKIGECACGAEIDLSDPMTNACDNCGRLYNGCGQELRPEEDWEEPWGDD